MSSDVPFVARRVIAYVDETERSDIDLRQDTNINFVGLSELGESIEHEIDIEEQPLLTVLDGNHFRIPEYQRLYSWSEPQFRELWATIEEIIEFTPERTTRPTFGIYFGALYLADSASDSRLEIIDGQQRLTTVSILSLIIKQVLEDRIDRIDADSDLSEFATHVVSQLDDILYETREFRSPRTSITLNDHDRKFYNQFLMQPDERVAYIENRLNIDRGKYDARYKEAIRVKELLEAVGADELRSKFDEDELDEHIYFAQSHQYLTDALSFFRSRVEELLSQCSTPDQEVRLLINLKNYLLRSFVVSRCQINSDDAALRMNIFESLNDKGLELNDVDLIRARIINRFAGHDNREQYLDEWQDVIKAFGANNSDIKEFLSYFVAATEHTVTTRSEANKSLMDVFNRKPGQSNAAPRMDTLENAKTLLDELSAFLPYYLDVRQGELERADSDLSDIKDQAEEILTRLHQTKQWTPLIAYVYQAVDSSPGGNQYLLDVLETVENIMFRRLISDARSNTVEELYVTATHKFREFERSDTIDEFEVENLNRYLIREARDSAPQMFGTSFMSLLIQESDWSNTLVKNLYWKIASEAHRDHETQSSISRELNVENVHVEHIFPRTPIQQTKTNPYAWLEYFFGARIGTDVSDEPEVVQLIQEYIEMDPATLEEGDPEFDRAEEIRSAIEEQFINDIGNMILLRSDLNESVRNQLFSRKLVRYLEDEFEDIYVNEYLTSDGEVPEEYLERLQDGDVDFASDETDRSLMSPLESELNDFWTYERSFDRKRQIVEDILVSLAFPSRPSEFEDALPEIDNAVGGDMENRVNDPRIGGIGLSLE